MQVNNFNLAVEFEEAGTGTVAAASWTGEQVEEAVKLDWGSSSDQHILGGFPYTGELRVTEQTGAAAEEEIRICIRLFRDTQEIKNMFNRKGVWQMTEDEIVEAGKMMAAVHYSSQCHTEVSTKGLIRFFVPLDRLPSDVTKLSINATAVAHPTNTTTGMKQPERKLDISLTHTAAPLSLALPEKEKQQIKCDAEFKPKIYLSSTKNEAVSVQYHALSKGVIYQTARVGVAAGQVSALEGLVADARELGAGHTTETSLLVPSEEIRVVSSVELNLAITPDVSPSLKLVVFVTVGNTTLTDSAQYEVEPCQHHRVKATWSEEKVTPGAEVELAVQADPDSLCALSASDKSVELLGNPNQVTGASLARLQEEIGDRKTSRSENYWEYQRSCPDTYQAIKVFESTGVQIMTDLSFASSCETIIDAAGAGGGRGEEVLNSPVSLAFDGGGC